MIVKIYSGPYICTLSTCHVSKKPQWEENIYPPTERSGKILICQSAKFYNSFVSGERLFISFAVILEVQLWSKKLCRREAPISTYQQKTSNSFAQLIFRILTLFRCKKSDSFAWQLIFIFFTVQVWLFTIRVWVTTPNPQLCWANSRKID